MGVGQSSSSSAASQGLSSSEQKFTRLYKVRKSFRICVRLRIK